MDDNNGQQLVRVPVSLPLFAQQLKDAVQQKNLEDLRTILLAKRKRDKNDETVETVDRAIHEAINDAAENGFLPAVQLLYPHLSKSAKNEYTLTENPCRDSSPLHTAAYNRHVDVVTFLLDKCKSNVNQLKYYFATTCTPLLCAMYADFGDDDDERRALEMMRLLLEQGADPHLGMSNGTCPLFWAAEAQDSHMARLLLEFDANPNFLRIPQHEMDDDDEVQDCPCHDYIPLFHAVLADDMDMARLLLEHGADPNLNRAAQLESYDHYRDAVVTDMAIFNENATMLFMLLQHGALLGPPFPFTTSTALNDMLEESTSTASLDTKISICRILRAQHTVKSDTLARSFIQASLLQVSIGDDAGQEYPCRLLLEHGGADPLLLVGDWNIGDYGQDVTDAPSPFLAAARNKNTAVLELFLDFWDERYAANNSKNEDGDYPLHVLCCDRKVSIQAIKLLVERQAHTVSTVDGEQGLYPFHFAAMWDAKLDVIYHLVRHSPEVALTRLRSMATTTTTINSISSGCTGRNHPTDSGQDRHSLSTNHASSMDGDETGNDSKSKESSSRLEDCGPAKKKSKTNV